MNLEEKMNLEAKIKIDLDPDERTKCEIWSRVMGYHRPINQWNTGKQQEWRDRKHFRESLAGRLLDDTPLEKHSQDHEHWQTPAPRLNWRYLESPVKIEL